MLLLLGEVEKARAKHPHRLFAVLDLRLLVLAAHDDAGRQVRDPDRRIRRVHRLAAGARRAEPVDAQVLLGNVDLDVLGLGQHGDGGRRRVDPSLGLGRGHALHAVDARFVLHAREHAVALDEHDRFLQAANRRFGLVEDLDPPLLAFGVSHVHPQQLGREERRLVAAGAGADLDEHVLVVVRVLRDERLAELALERVAPFGERTCLVVDHLPQLVVRRRRARHLARRCQLAVELAEGAEERDHRLDLGQRARRLAQPLRVAQDLGRSETIRELGVRGFELPQLMGDVGHVRLQTSEAPGGRRPEPEPSRGFEARGSEARRSCRTGG